MATAVDTEALRDASESIQELLRVAQRTAQLLVASLEPDSTEETRAELAELAKKYADLCLSVRNTLTEQAGSILGAAAEAQTTLPTTLVPDTSLAARTEAEIAARKLLVLARRLATID